MGPPEWPPRQGERTGDRGGGVQKPTRAVAGHPAVRTRPAGPLLHIGDDKVLRGLLPLQAEGLVGHAPSRLMRSRDLVDTVLPRLKRDPCVFLHPRDAGCEECADAWQAVQP